jgi:hypothetical protein
MRVRRYVTTLTTLLTSWVDLNSGIFFLTVFFVTVASANAEESMQVSEKNDFNLKQHISRSVRTCPGVASSPRVCQPRSKR